jgi:tetratricopeptide (TPR) repeat protein
MATRQLVTMLLFGAVAYAMLFFRARSSWKQRQARQRLVTAGQLPIKRRRPPWTAANIFLLVHGIVLATAYIFLADRLGTVPTLALLAPFFLAGIAVNVWMQNRNKDPFVRRADELTRANQLPQAIDHLRTGLKEKETAERLHTLSLLLMKQQSATEALQAAERASQLAPGLPRYDATRAMLMARTGNTTGGLELMQHVREREPAEVLYACLLCQLLADAGRIEEAQEQLRQAEELRKVAATEQQEGESFWRGSQLLEECRKKIGTAPPRSFPVATESPLSQS